MLLQFALLCSADSPALFSIATLSILLGKTVLGLAILKILYGLIAYFTPKIKRAIAFFKQKISKSSDEGDTWILILLGLGVLFLALGLLLKTSIFAVGFLWGGVIILGGFLIGFCIGSINGN